MKITATDKALRVDYRAAGKFYRGQHPESGVAQDDGKISDSAFDSAELQPGDSLSLGAGDELVRVTVLGLGKPAEFPNGG